MFDEPPPGGFPWWCRQSEDESENAIATADQLLADIYAFPPFPTVTLPSDMTWAEDPFDDRSWQLRQQSLRFVLPLLEAWQQTGSVRYRDRAIEVVIDWIDDNPQADPPSEFSWSDHGTALRATVLACATLELGEVPTLVGSLVAHGSLLADPHFYRGRFNHALDQSIGLIDVAAVLEHSGWSTLAGRRINDLLLRSIDSQGVTNEQAVAYQRYNYVHYSIARRRMVEVGLPVSSAFARVDRMPRFLAHATLPNGEYDMIGDTDRELALEIPGTIAQFAATQGASGPKPSSTTAIYGAGFLFARSGWGEHRPYGDEVEMSVRFGPPRISHGHDDQAALTLYGYGTKLLSDRGKYTYNRDRWRTYFTGRSAHNVVTVDGLAWDKTKGTTLRSSLVHSRVIDVRLSSSGYPGVGLRRRVTFSRRLHWVVVEDRLTSTTTHTYRQLWHLMPDSGPLFGRVGVLTTRPHGNVVIRQLAGSTTSRLLSGRTSPIQGWQAFRQHHKEAAPTLEARQRGRTVRYLTLIVPGSTNPRVRVSSLQTLSDGYAMTITVNGESERIRVNGTSVSISTP